MTAGEEQTLELPGGVEIVFCYVPPGSFRMGQRGESDREEPVHDVVITRGFWLGKYPVTQEQFACWREEPEYEEWFSRWKERIKKTSWNEEAERHKNDFKDHPPNPADSVIWWEAVEFANWLWRKEGKEIHERLGAELCPRLPTEAEWEHACRAGTETEYYTGDGEEALMDAGCYDGNSGNKTHPVGEKEPNAWGLHDLHGNVWEWCEDGFDAEVYKKRASGCQNPVETNENEQAHRVLRGGSWNDAAWLCRAAYRDWFGPGLRNWVDGFRLGLFPGPVPARPAGAEPAPGAGSEGRAEGGESGRSDLLDRNFFEER